MVLASSPAGFLKSAQIELADMSTMQNRKKMAIETARKDIKPSMLGMRPEMPSTRKISRELGGS